MRIASLIVPLVFFVSMARGELPSFDFTRDDQISQWKPIHDIRNLSTTPDGARFEITGEDPYLVGPPRDYPAGVGLRVSMRLRCGQLGVAQIFYFKDHATEPDSVRIPVLSRGWTEVQGDLPPLGRGYRLRIDPPGTGGACVLQSVRFTALRTFPQPGWPKPIAITDAKSNLTLISGDVKLLHDGKHPAGFVLEVAGKSTAIGWTNTLIGYLDADKPVWLPTDPRADCHVKLDGNAVSESLSLRDPAGANWHLSRTYTPKQPGAIEVLTTISVTQDRNILFLPLLGLFPGAGSFGARKTQALFPGLEYLDKDEPSSSEADVIGPASRRQVPDVLKIAFPLMTIAADGRYVGLMWEQQPRVAAVFDSPDRLFQSGGHFMGLIFPGSDGTNRLEGSLLPRDPALLRANQPMELRATIIGGTGSEVTPAVRQYVALRGLPPVKKPMDFDAYLHLASAGWLDSHVRDGAQYRHAIPGHFAAQPAADAAMMQDWLASQSTDPDLTRRLRDAARIAIANVPPQAYNFSGVSHIRYPVESLVYGHVAEAADEARRQGHALLSRFEPDGSVRYRPRDPADDLGKTHFAPDANGLAASLVAQVLENATASGDADLIREGLRLLRALDKFAATVPRGAQTWEVPLHTPDVLASAHLVRAYTLGYELTGEAHLLDQAKYWAWTGVPFVYLTAPADPVGLYASIPVFGATHWRAPVWMGLPVQWCALVYADALYRLSPHDPLGPWKQLADGITASGIQQTWPIGSDPLRQGLLPDSFNLRAQSRNDAAINPGTLQADAVRFYDRPPVYDFHSFRVAGLLLHAPGRIAHPRDASQGISFNVESWSPGPYYVLVAGLKHRPRVTVGGREIDLSDPNQYDPTRGRLILRLKGRADVQLTTAPPTN